MNSRLLLKELKAAGWDVVRVRGNHNQLKHSDHGYVIIAPDPKKDLPKGLVKVIKKQAYLKV